MKSGAFRFEPKKKKKNTNQKNIDIKTNTLWA